MEYPQYYCIRDTGIYTKVSGPHSYTRIRHEQTPRGTRIELYDIKAHGQHSIAMMTDISYPSTEEEYNQVLARIKETFLN